MWPTNKLDFLTKWNTRILSIKSLYLNALHFIMTYESMNWGGSSGSVFARPAEYQGEDGFDVGNTGGPNLSYPCKTRQTHPGNR